MAEPTIESIRPRTSRMGRIIVHLAECGSTMDEARRLAEEGAEDGTVVVADRQTVGRGRSQRGWFSPEGALLATLIVRPRTNEHLTLLSLAAGTTLARSMQRLVRAPARVKWPNDVWIEGKKVAGVLVESRFLGSEAQWALVGIGANVDVRSQEFPQDVRALATSLSMWAGRHVCLPALLKVWLERFEASLVALEEGRGAGIVEEAQSLLVGLGAEVEGQGAHGPVRGTIVRLGPDGELVLATGSGETAVREGDVTLLRPVAAQRF